MYKRIFKLRALQTMYYSSEMIPCDAQLPTPAVQAGLNSPTS